MKTLKPITLLPSHAHGNFIRLLSQRAHCSSATASNMAMKDVGVPLKEFPVGKKTGDGRTMMVKNLFNPSETMLSRLREIWNKAWSYGIDEENPSSLFLKETLLVSVEQIRQMHENSWNNILIGEIDGRIEAAIWGVQLDIGKGAKDYEIISNYNRTTASKTFRNTCLTGNSRFCVSVAVNPDYNGFKTDSGLSLGQVLVISSLEKVVIHPYQTDVYAYSRPSSLSRFAELLWGLKRGMGIDIAYDKGRECWVAEKEGERSGAEVTEKGIKIGDSLYSFRNTAVGKIVTEDEGYRMQPGNARIFMDGEGVRVREDSGKEYLLVAIDPYLNRSKFDQMVNFHGGRGGEIKAVFPQSRVFAGKNIGDPISLNYNILFKFPIGRVIERNYLFPEIFKLFNREQQKVMVRAIVDPEKVGEQVARIRFPKSLYRGAFSAEKMGDLLHYVAANRDILLQLIRSKAL